MLVTGVGCRRSRSGRVGRRRGLRLGGLLARSHVGGSRGARAS